MDLRPCRFKSCPEHYVKKVAEEDTAQRAHRRRGEESVGTWAVGTGKVQKKRHCDRVEAVVEKSGRGKAGSGKDSENNYKSLGCSEYSWGW